MPVEAERVVRQYLIDRGVITGTGGTSGVWPSTAGPMPATVGNHVTLQGTGADIWPSTLSGEDTDFPSFQVMVRALDYSEGMFKAKEIRAKFREVGTVIAGSMYLPEVTVAGETYRLEHVHRSTAFSKVGQEEKNRQQFISGNFTVTMTLMNP